MAFTAWAATTSYSVGDKRRAVALVPTGLVFKCTTAGTSGSSEPPWGTDIGTETTDNTVVWTAVSAVYEELAVLAPNAVIELFELHLSATLHGSSDVYRWHDGINEAVTGGIVWNGNTYNQTPVSADGFAYTGRGMFPRPTLAVSNINSVITTLMVLVNATTPGNDLVGAKVKRIRVLKKHLDGQPEADPYAQWPTEIYLIDRKTSESTQVVTFELASELDKMNERVPRRSMIANVCQWEYRSPECGYSGSNYWDKDDNSVSVLSQDRCGKRLASCVLRFGGSGGVEPLPFGSFPGVGLTR